MIHLSINIELKKDYTESYLHINSSLELYAGLRSEYIEKKALVHRQRQCNNFYTISFILHHKKCLQLKHSFFLVQNQLRSKLCRLKKWRPKENYFWLSQQRNSKCNFSTIFCLKYF